MRQSFRPPIAAPPPLAAGVVVGKIHTRPHTRGYLHENIRGIRHGAHRSPPRRSRARRKNQVFFLSDSCTRARHPFTSRDNAETYNSDGRLFKFNVRKTFFSFFFFAAAQISRISIVNSYIYMHAYTQTHAHTYTHTHTRVCVQKVSYRTYIYIFV